jgi:hypothetical protein
VADPGFPLAGAEQAAGVDLVEPIAPHLEPGHLAFRPEPVLASTEHPKPGAWLAVEGQNDIHRMLQRPGPGDVTVLRYVAGQEDRDAFRLGQPDERVRAAPNLRGSAGHLATSRVPEALDGIDGEQERPFRPGRVHERPQLSAGGERHSIAGDPQPTSAEGNLVPRLLTGGKEAGEPGSRQVRHQLEEKGGLADVSLFVRQDPWVGDRRDHVYTMSQNAPQFAHPRRGLSGCCTDPA